MAYHITLSLPPSLPPFLPPPPPFSLSLSLSLSAESRWAHVRSGAHSYPTHSSGSTLQAMLQPPNPQPLLTEKEREQVREIPSATATDTSSKVHTLLWCLCVKCRCVHDWLHLEIHYLKLNSTYILALYLTFSKLRRKCIMIFYRDLEGNPLCLTVSVYSVMLCSHSL